MMNYSDFLEYVRDNIKAYLPSEYARANVEVRRTEKYFGESYDGLCLTPENSDVGVCLNLNDIYSNVESAKELDTALTLVSEDIINAMSQRPENIELYTRNYEIFLDNVNLQIINARNNRAMIEDIPHVIYDDMAIIYRLVIPHDHDSNLTTVVTNGMIEALDIDIDNLQKRAIMNLETKYNIIIEELSPDKKVYFASLDEFALGSVCLVHPGFVAKASAIIKDNFYILPLSREGLLLFCDSKNLSVDYLRETAFRLSTFGFCMEERLTKNIYYCNILKGEISKVEAYVN